MRFLQRKCEREFLQFPHCAVWKNKKTRTEKIFRQINSLVISLVSPLRSRNFCQKMVRVNFHNFYTVRNFHTAVNFSFFHTISFLQKLREIKNQWQHQIVYFSHEICIFQVEVYLFPCNVFHMYLLSVFVFFTNCIWWLV